MNRKRVFGISDVHADRGAGYVRTRRLLVELLEERRLLSANALTSDLPRDLDVFGLHSYEGAAAVLYLDFNGHTTANTEWNTTYNDRQPIVTPAFSFDDDYKSFSIEECSAIYEIWRRVAEDYLPFNIDVTTEKPVGDNCSGANIQRVVIGGSCTDWYVDSGSTSGVAYIGSYGYAADVPCFVFSENCAGSFKIIADAISHESGHTFGLLHDGCTTTTPAVEYYPGSNGWGPIMGAPYGQELTQWSKGEYAGGANISNGKIQSGQQDDLALIAAKIAEVNKVDGYRADDYGDTISQAAAISLDDGSGFVSGIIGRTADVDYFSFTGTGAALDFWVGGGPDVTNLDVLVKIYDSGGVVLAEYDPLDTLFCAFTWESAADTTYYLSVTGTGKTVGSVVYYTNYGSLGAYDIVIGTGPALVVTTESDTIFSDGKLSLREAILLAGGNGVIRFAESLRGKTITLCGDAFLISRSVTIDAAALGTANLVGGTDWGITLNAGGLSQIFWIQRQSYWFDGETVHTGSGSLDVALFGLELIGGRVESETESVYGGAVFCNGGTLWVESCRFYGNESNRSVSSNYFSGGGAIYTGGNLTIRDCVFENNTAKNSFGGAILVLGGVTTIHDSRFVSNSAEQGGAFYFNGVSASLVGCVLVENEAKIGGGGFIDTNVLFVGCDLLRNQAVRGGGLYVVSGVSVSFDLGTICGNEAVSLDPDLPAGGGGVCNFGTLTVTGSVVAGNAAFGILEAPNEINSGLGGGIYSSGTLTLINVTCAGNFANYYGGGVYNSGTISATNSILYGNTGIDSSDDFYVRGDTKLDYSLYRNGKRLGGSFSGANNISGSSVNAGFICFTAISAYENWSNTLYQGWNLRLTDGSAAIDAGSNKLAVDSKQTPITTDLDGLPRILDGDRNGNPLTDMGAFEYRATFSVAAQAGCDVFLGEELKGKTVRFDLDGDGVFDQISVNGFVPASQFAGSDGSTVLAVAFNPDGSFFDSFLFDCTVISRPSLWYVQSAAFCDGAILKLAIDALTDSAVVRWTLDWGDESASVFDSAAQTLRTVHSYSTDVSNMYSVKLTAEFANSATETVTLLSYAIVRLESSAKIEQTEEWVSKPAENASDTVDSAPLSASNTVRTLQAPAANLSPRNDFFPLPSKQKSEQKSEQKLQTESKRIAPAADISLSKSPKAACWPLCAATQGDAVFALDTLFAGDETEFFTPDLYCNEEETDEPDAVMWDCLWFSRTIAD